MRRLSLCLGFLLLSAACFADDRLRELQTAAIRDGQSPAAHWGTDPDKYTQWGSHSNRLIPVYAFGTKDAGQGIDLRDYQGENSPYRSEDALRRIYGYLPQETVAPEAAYFDQTNLYDIQKAALAAGKKHIFLVVFDGMGWPTTRAAAIHQTGRVGYDSGRGAGLHFQEYTADGTTQFGYMVTSPHNDGTRVNVDTQTVINPGGTQRGGYDPRRGGPAPWTPGSEPQYLIGQPKSDPTSHAYTDSSSSAQSMTSGTKTYNSAINVDPAGGPVTTIAHEAQEQGYAVGVVTSVPISHATPAAAYAHNVDRDDYQDITRDLIGRPSISHPRKPLPGMDVVIGAGWGAERDQDKGQGENFVPGNRYLTAEDLAAVDVEHGGRYVVARRQPGVRGAERLAEAARRAVELGQRLLGFYGDESGHLPFQTADGDYQPAPGRSGKAEVYTSADRAENPTLAEMAAAALTVLEKHPKGFWLMVEAGDVDWANHDNNLDTSIGAVTSGDAAVKVVTDWVERHSNWDESLLIVTADHGHYLVLDRPELLAASAAVGQVSNLPEQSAGQVENLPHKDRAEAQGWSARQIAKLPKGETPVRLFNGKDLSGWKGQEKYWSVQDGVIVGKNDKENAPQVSTYLVTDKEYRNFRLIFEAKLVQSEMHTGIALWGETVEKAGDPYSYKGHLVMFPSGYGFWDLYRRNSIYKDDGRAKKAGKQHGWNRMEILATGDRIRHVINGKLVADWTEPMPDLIQPGPLGLQLHSNKVPQEVHFRGLVLTENPEDRLVTVQKPAAPKNDAAASVGMDAETLTRIRGRMFRMRDRMRDFVDAGKTSGAVTLVARNGIIVQHAAVGQADIEQGRSMSPVSLFAVASMTKPITATAVMILRDEGKLSLDDPVSKYVPEFKDVVLENGQPPKREITLRDLLTHTSGLTGSQENTGTLAETAAAMAQRPLAFEPGTKWAYSPGLSVCGRVIEVVSGQSYEDFLTERIFRPLGMKDTTFFPTPEQQKRIVRLYQPGEDGKLEAATHWISDLSAGRTANPSGGLFSTAADMFWFYQMVLNGGELDGKRIVSREAVREMTTVQTGDLTTGFTPGNGWGLGWCVVRQPQGVSAMLSPGTFGHGGAFGTQGWVDPERRMIFVLMIQRTNFGNSDASAIRQAFQELAVEAVRE